MPSRLSLRKGVATRALRHVFSPPNISHHGIGRKYGWRRDVVRGVREGCEANAFRDAPRRSGGAGGRVGLAELKTSSARSSSKTRYCGYDPSPISGTMLRRETTDSRAPSMAPAFLAQTKPGRTTAQPSSRAVASISSLCLSIQRSAAREGTERGDKDDSTHAMFAAPRCSSAMLPATFTAWIAFHFRG